MIRNCFANCLGDGTENDLEAICDDGDAEILSALERNVQEQKVPVSSARMNEIRFVDKENEVTMEVSNWDLAKEIAEVHGSDTKDGETESNGDKALPGLQVQLESLTSARSFLHNSEHIT